LTPPKYITWNKSPLFFYITSTLLRNSCYILHGKKRGEEDHLIRGQKKYPARRWVVERTHAWHNKFRRLFVRWERKVENYKAMIHLASALIIYRIIAAP
jgi:hypothetical protein